MNKKILNILLMIFFTTTVSAQWNDAQLWENIGIEKNFSPRLSARIIHEGRLSENYSRPGFFYFDLGAGYKLNKHVHFTLAYVWVQKRLPDDSWSPRHQIYAYITLKKKLKDFTFNDRQMVLWQVKDYSTSVGGKNPDYYLRNKITIRYDKIFKWAPYIASELYYKASSHDAVAYRFDRIRYFAGLFYRTNVHNEFEAYYLVEKHLNTSNPQTNWVIGLGYTHSL